jgi:hypothetical protein
MPDINGIPYVEPGDLVSGYPSVSQSLAQEVSDQLASKLDATSPVGKVLQVVSFTTDVTFSTSSGSFVDVTNLSVTLTPATTSSKVLVLAALNVGTTPGSNRAALRLMRDTTPLNVGASVGSRTPASAATYSAISEDIENESIVYLDSPNSVASTTYKIQMLLVGGGSVHINRSSLDTDSSGQFRTASTLTALEIGA